MSVTWRATARDDVVRIIGHIAEENPIAAWRMARELVLAGDSLGAFPHRGRPGLVPGTRELLIIQPYVVVYEVNDADDVTILRVWHGAQDRA
ncbi:MAG: type II toxin-antitoxin system RelE/ParE family toxin [Alphaproteobacteria bacterium]|nr:type II toxin-antitoxin system RelE/ParE family toxin [Alphaproteobacteria bacterium]